MTNCHPLLLTLDLDSASAQRFEALRRAHFPPERNFLPAHVTLFHALPGEHEEAVLDELGGLCARTAPFGVRFPCLRRLGRGVAAVLAAPELLALHQRLAARWRSWLTPQDAQPLRPHVTIQNKVTPDEARALFEDLSAVWTVPDGQASGLRLWHYLGGPWALVTALSFTGNETAPDLR
jgi:2'-5' RNA ligase